VHEDHGDAAAPVRVQREELGRYLLLTQEIAGEKPAQLEIPGPGSTQPVGQRRRGLGLQGDRPPIDLDTVRVVRGIEL
jgi:hypothetical protein